MDDRLVFDLVRHYGIRPALEQRRKKSACALCGALRSLFPNANVTRERYLVGMIEVLHWMSDQLLAEFDYATEWHRVEKVDDYYPLRIRGLNLERTSHSVVM